MRPSLLIAASTAALFCTQAVHAEEGMMEEKAAPPMTAPAPSSAPTSAKPLSRAEEILQRFDLNHDGKIDDDEKAGAHEVMMQEQMTKGANPAVNREFGPLAALAVELFDRNGDSRLDENERLDVLAFVQQRTDDTQRGALRKRFDKNTDGVLDETERAESQAYVAEHRGELMQEVLLRRFDKNADGQLDVGEKAIIREEFLKPAVKPESPKPLDAAQQKAITAEIERRRAARQEKAPAVTPQEEKKK